MTADEPKTSDRSADVGIVFALELEADPLVGRLRRRRKTTGHRFHLVEGTLADRRLAVVWTGSGPTRLWGAADALLFVHRPRWLVAAGFAVGLNDQIRNGDLLLANEMLDRDGGRLSVDFRLSSDGSSPPGVHVGGLLSLTRLPHTALEKRELGERTAALAADTQSFTLARLCAAQATKFLAVRVITEEASEDAKPDSLVAYHSSRSFRAGGLMGAFLSGAGRAGKILKARGIAKSHAERLAAFLIEILPRLV